MNADKEAGLKPKKIPKHVEDGSDDCGDDLSGLGKDIALLQYDVHHEAICESDSDDDDSETLWLDIFGKLPQETTRTANSFSIIASLCCGKKNYHDILELRGGAGGVPEVAFARGLLSAGNVD